MTVLPVITSLCRTIFLYGLGAYAGAALSLSNASAAPAPTETAQPQPTAAAQAGTQLVYVGGYTKGDSQGIYLFRLDMASGKLTPAGAGPQTANPSFLIVTPNHRYVYAVNEFGAPGSEGGAVSAFSIDPHTGALTFLNRQPSGGTGPCHLAIDKTDKNILVANYNNGNVSLLRVRPDGGLEPPTVVIQHTGSGVDPNRQEGPHAHCVAFDAANRFAFSTDLGLDKIFVYRFDPRAGTLTAHGSPGEVAPGSGPRHLVFHPNGHYAYVINEMKSTVTVFTYDAKSGTLHAIQAISTLPEGFQGSNTAAEVQVSPDGKFLYGSNRGHDSIVIFSIEADTGKLTLVGHQSTQGKNPRNFCIDPTGTYLLDANQDSNNLVVFRIQPQTGQLTPTGNTADVPMPVCIQIVPAGH